MKAETAVWSPGRVWIIAVMSCAALLALVVYAFWAACLALGASQGSLPPRSRVPEVPSGVRDVRVSTPCASGGCWREIVLLPAAGQSPGDLADEMGLSNERHYSWRLLDPHSVSVGATVRGDRLSIYVQY